MKQSHLGLLLALDALLSERNVTRAAARLNISQPAMSAQLSRLRDLFGDPLLVASGREMVPSARAMSLQEPLHEKLVELAQLIRERQPFEPGGTSRVFRIIAPDYLHMLVTLPLVRKVSQNAPNIQIVMLPFEPASAWQTLENLKADLLVMWKELTPEEARATPLFVEEICLVQRKGHPRGRKKPSVDDLCTLSHVIIAPEAGALWGVIDEELEKRGRKRRIVASLPSFLAVPALIAQSDLVAAIPRRLAESTAHQLDLFDIPLPLERYEILLSWHPRMHADPGHQWLRTEAAASASVSPKA